MFQDSLEDPIRPDNINHSKKIGRIELRTLRHKVLCTSESPRNKFSKQGDASPASPMSVNSQFSSFGMKNCFKNKKNSVRNHRVQFEGSVKKAENFVGIDLQSLNSDDDRLSPVAVVSTQTHHRKNRQSKPRPEEVIISEENLAAIHGQQFQMNALMTKSGKKSQTRDQQIKVNTSAFSNKNNIKEESDLPATPTTNLVQFYKKPEKAPKDVLKLKQNFMQME